MSQPQHVIDYADVTLRARPPATNLRLTLWLLVLSATVFAVSRWVVPRVLVDYEMLKLQLPGVSVGFVTSARRLASPIAAAVFTAISIGLPMAFARLTWSGDRADGRFAYRRMVAIHIVTCLLLIYLLAAAVCLMLPYVLTMRSMRP